MRKLRQLHFFSALFKNKALKPKLIIAIVHEKKKIFQCGICSSSFITKSSVNRHTLAVHEKNKNFNCHLCNVTFAIKSNLKRHILSVHEKIKRIRK